MAKTTTSTTKKATNWRPWLITVAVLLLIISSLSFFVTNNIYNSSTFASKVTQAVQTETVRDAMASQITSEILADQSPVAAKVLTQPVNTLVSGLLKTDAFNTVVYNFSFRLNKFLTTKDFEPITIDISSATTTIEAVADRIRPDNELDLSRFATEEIVLLDDVDLPPFRTIGQTLLISGPLALLALLALAVTSLIKMKDKWNFAKFSSIVLGISGVVLLVLSYTSGALLTITIIDPERSTIMQEIYSVFIANFQAIALGMVVVAGIIYAVYYFHNNRIKLDVDKR